MQGTGAVAAFGVPWLSLGIHLVGGIGTIAVWGATEGALVLPIGIAATIMLGCWARTPGVPKILNGRRRRGRPSSEMRAAAGRLARHSLRRAQGRSHRATDRPAEREMRAHVQSCPFRRANRSRPRRTPAWYDSPTEGRVLGLPDGIRRVLVVEDEESIRAAVGRVMRGWGAEVGLAETAADAGLRLGQAPPPDLILIDVHLPDGLAFLVLEAAARLSPTPVAIAMSAVASPDEILRLAQVGVRGYLAKPFDVDDLESTIQRAVSEPPALDPAITARVGHVGMEDAQHQVRLVMVKEALARAQGSRSRAARLLHVTRQAIQQIVRAEGRERWPEASGIDREERVR